jgi:CrcB protein
MISVLLVLVGGAIGSLCRYWWSGLVAQRLGETFPYGTLFVNLIGSLIIGLAGGFLNRMAGAPWEQPLRVFVAVGFCGGLTTFSSFSLQTLNLIAGNRWGAALVNILVSTTMCLGLVATGWWIAQNF